MSHPDGRPTLSPDQLASYLERIGIGVDGTAAGDRHALGRWHRAHVRTIPFENIDIHLGRRLSLDLDHLHRKLVVDRRGGFCYEQNLLLAAALDAAGFAVTLVQAQVRSGESYGPPFDHMALRVETDAGPMLADVGFGQCFQQPLAMDGAAHPQPDGWSYRLESTREGFLLHARDPAGDEAIAYRLDPTPRRPHEYEGMCHHHQTSPESHFTRGWVASLATADGRRTLKPGSLIETRRGERRETAVDSLAETRAILADRFGMTGIALPPDFPWSP